MNLVKQINFIKMDYFVSRCVSTTMLSMTIKLIKSKKLNKVNKFSFKGI